MNKVLVNGESLNRELKMEELEMVTGNIYLDFGIQEALKWWLKANARLETVCAGFEHIMDKVMPATAEKHAGKRWIHSHRR